MTAPGTDGGRTETARAELAHLLPAPAERDLPEGRHAHHKERLMRTIDNESGPAQEPARSGAGAERGAGASARGWFRRPAILVPVASAALAVSLAAGLLLGGGDGDGDPAHKGATGEAGAVLSRISEAAMTGESAPSVGGDQFVYEQSKIREGDETSGKVVTGPLMSSETWYSQRPGPVKQLGEYRQDGERGRMNGELGEDDGMRPGLSRPTYRWKASLPTDPDKLLEYLYAKAHNGADQERDQEVFNQIRGLAGGVVPPRFAGTAYEAAGRIPGVVRAPGAHDAIGRTGVGIARTDTSSGERSEWVFDADSLRYLGCRTYLTEDSSRGKKGALLFSEAVLRIGVVDKSGTAPTDDQIVASTPPRRAGS